MTRWQQFYLEDSRIPSVAASKFAQRAAHVFVQNQKQKILDLACGAGRDSFYLAGHSLHVTAVDLARSGLEIASRSRAHPQRGAVDFTQADARRLPFSAGVFEGVFCFGLLHEFTGPDGSEEIIRVMAEIRRVLSPGGILHLAVLSGDPLQGLPHVLLFSEAMFDCATQGFTLIEKKLTDDLGCTGRKDYHTWQGIYRKNA